MYRAPRTTHGLLHLAFRVLHFLMRAYLIGILLRPVFPAFAQDQVTFTASVDRTALTTDDVLTLQLTLSGAFHSSGQPQFPPLEGFVIVGSSQSSQFSIVNGKTSSQVVFTYRLQPTRTGALTIPSISIQVGNQTYQSEPVTIEVTQGTAPQAGQPTTEPPPHATAPGGLAGQDFYVEADVDNPTPVVGEQITYRFRLYQAVQFFGQPQLAWPDFTGFLGYDLSPNNQYYQRSADREYLVTEVRRALFPTAPGEVTIGPATLTIPGDFFNEAVQLQTDAVTVNVHPLPEGAPDDFAGAVGQFEIEAWIKPTQASVNEPLTLFVRVSGVGNVDMLADPTAGIKDTLSNWRVYDPQVTAKVGQDDDLIRGEKVFERPMVPKVDGDLTLPSFGLTFFDPGEGAYRHVETEPFVVHVTPGEAQAPGPVAIGGGKQDVVLLASDIRHIKPVPPTLVTRHPSLLAQPLYWLGWLLPLLTVGGTWLLDRRRRHLAQNVALARAQRARRLAHRRLSEARKLVKTNEDAAYAAVARAVTAYLGDKLNLPAAGLTHDAIRQRLAARAVPVDLTERLLTCLERADSGRFAPTAAGHEVVDLAREVESIIAELEKALA